MKTEKHFVIVLRPLPKWPTSPEHRLRALLKAAVRSYGLRCMEVRAVQQIAPPTKGKT